jgi:hypothetical protein
VRSFPTSCQRYLTGDVGYRIIVSFGALRLAFLGFVVFVHRFMCYWFAIKRPTSPKLLKYCVMDRLTPSEYADLWTRQCELFWSRLQTTTALHTAIIAGWFVTFEKYHCLSNAILSGGVLIGFLLWLIMWRDGDFMIKMKKAINDDTFDVPHRGPNGKQLAYFIVWIPIIGELVLLWKVLPAN